MHGHCNSPAPVTQNGKPLACTLKKIIFHDWKIGYICFYRMKKKPAHFLSIYQMEKINLSMYLGIILLISISGMYLQVEYVKIYFWIDTRVCHIFLKWNENKCSVYTLLLIMIPSPTHFYHILLCIATNKRKSFHILHISELHRYIAQKMEKNCAITIFFWKCSDLL